MPDQRSAIVQSRSVIEGPKFSQHQLVDPRLVEGSDFVAVLVRVAEHDFAQTVLRRHHVDSVLIEVGRLFVDAAA